MYSSKELCSSSHSHLYDNPVCNSYPESSKPLTESTPPPASLKVQPLHEHKEKCFFFGSYMISFYLGLTSWTERYLCKKSPLVGGCVTHSCNGSFLENECLRSWFSVCSSSLILSRDWKWMSPYSPLTLSLPSIGNVTASMDLQRINCRPKKESFKIYQNQSNYWIATVQIPLTELKNCFLSKAKIDNPEKFLFQTFSVLLSCIRKWNFGWLNNPISKTKTCLCNFCTLKPYHCIKRSISMQIYVAEGGASKMIFNQ